VKILVTGGAGYVGTTLLRRLLAEGHSVRCLDPKAADVPRLLALTRDRRLRCDLVVGDIRDPRVVRDAMAGVDAVVHLAALVGYPACDADPEGARSSNVEGTRNVVCSIPLGLPLIFLSTCSVYGRRAANERCSETDPARPLTLYGETKLIAERIVLDHGGIALRASTAYGLSPQFRWDLIIHRFLQIGLSNGRLRLFEPGALRTFIHVDDIVEAVCFALGHSAAMSGNAYNTGSQDGTLTKLDLAERIAALTGLVIEIDHENSDPEGRWYGVSFDRIEALGFRTCITFDEGLQMTAAGVRLLTLENPALR
jgi:nucleoside-diphosphate-sugar epimerase